MKIILTRIQNMLFMLSVCIVGVCFVSKSSVGYADQRLGNHNPLIFVHGGAGSASQFASQAMRLHSNGYPHNYLYALEYDSTFSIETMDQIHQRLDALVKKVMEKTRATKVDLMGHSLGTRVSQEYLGSSVERAEKIGNYVNLDGYPAEAPPGGVRSMAIWAGISISDRGQITGAENIKIENQTHVELATSAETFAHFFKFFTGKEPELVGVSYDRGLVSIRGRVTLFPQNVGVEGAKLEIYQLDGQSGQRLTKKPKATFDIDASGDWGTFKAIAGKHYEFAIVREGQVHHIYREPFIHDDHFVRLQTSPVGAGVGANMDQGDNHSNIVVSRDKEFWGELPMGNDLLVVNGTNVINAANSPLSNRTTAIYLYDAGADGQSDLTQPITYFHELPFITGNDFHIPASTPAKGRIRFTLIPRGSNGLIQMINIPNWASSTDRVSVVFNDFIQKETLPEPYPFYR